MECPLHASEFTLRTGEVDAPLAKLPGRLHKVPVVDGQILVEESQRGAQHSAGPDHQRPRPGTTQAVPHSEGSGFVRSYEDVSYPNLTFHFLPVAVRYDGQTDEEILDWVARDAETALQPSCTAKTGPASDPLAVADLLAVMDPLTMKVNGSSGLRVADAPAMPYVTNGNIYAPVMMLAEKAADLCNGRELGHQGLVEYRETKHIRQNIDPKPSHWFEPPQAGVEQ